MEVNALTGVELRRVRVIVGRRMQRPRAQSLTGAWQADQRRLRSAVRERRDGSEAAVAQPASASVIVPCLDAGGVIARCLAHLLRQDHPAFEIIVVDDGSSDQTARIARQALRGKAGTVVSHSGPRGVSFARNRGVEAASGEVMAFIDADGFAEPGWLRALCTALAGDSLVGGAASLVFFEGNPLVINGAGGRVNRQGWAADLRMGESFAFAELPGEALYAMGCGMAFRREVIERVGPFDEGIVNYYDDVDYGVRTWRSGYRVTVAQDAWIDHAPGSTAALGQRRSLCERHRVRVALKHAAPGELAPWVANEARALLKARGAGVRAARLRAAAWNLRHLESILGARRRLRGAPRPPRELKDPSWGDGFPAAVPEVTKPDPERVGATFSIASDTHAAQLVHGWYPIERLGEERVRWAAASAALLLASDLPTRRLRLDYTPTAGPNGEVELYVRRVGSKGEPVTMRLPWLYVSRAVENRPIDLPAGLFEVSLRARPGWREPPNGLRSLALAVREVRLVSDIELPPGGLHMADPPTLEQLAYGWYALERDASGRHFRWSAAEAAVIVRLDAPVASLRLRYLLPPEPTAGVKVRVGDPGGGATPAEFHLAWQPGWREEQLPLEIPAGEHLITFAAETWVAPSERASGPGLPRRELGVALSALVFD